MRLRRHACSVFLVLSTIALAACSSGGGNGAAPGHVTIYSGRTQNLIEPILERFAEETGIDVDVRYGQSADLALLISEEGAKSPADLFLSQSPGSVGYLDAKGLLGTLPQDVRSIVADGLSASDGSWVGFSGRKRVLVYNPKNVQVSQLPTTVLDVTKPEWKGRVGVAPSNASFQDFVSGMRVKLGDDTTKKFLKGLADNDAFTFANNAAVVAAIGRGEIDLGLVNHYYVYQALAENPSFTGKNYDLPPDDIGSLLIVTAASVLKSSKNQDAAVQLVRFLLQEEAQRYFSDQTFEYPLATGVSAASVLPPVTFVRSEGVDLDKLGGSLESTRQLIRDAGLEG
jgi:iron(III) transport system substrate-binding protein